MLTKILSTPELKFSDGAISLNKRIAGRTADVALARARKALKDIAHADDPMRLLSQLHDDQEELEDLLPQLEASSLDLLAAADILDGQPVTRSGPMIDAAVAAFELASALRSADPSLDLSDMKDTADNLRKAADAVAEQYSVTKARCAKLDIYMCELVGHSLARADTSAKEILDLYEPPQDWDLSAKGTHTVQRIKLSTSGNHHVSEPEVIHDYDKAVRLKARLHLNKQKTAKTVRRERDKVRKHREIQDAVHALWGADGGGS